MNIMNVLEASASGVLTFTSGSMTPVLAVAAVLMILRAFRIKEEESGCLELAVPPGLGLLVIGFSGGFLLLNLPSWRAGALALEFQPFIRMIGGGAAVVWAAQMLMETYRQGAGGESEDEGVSGFLILVMGAGAAAAFNPHPNPFLYSATIFAATQEGRYMGGALLALYAAGMAAPLWLTSSAVYLIARLVPAGSQFIVWGDKVFIIILTSWGVLTIFGFWNWAKITF